MTERDELLEQFGFDELLDPEEEKALNEAIYGNLENIPEDIANDMKLDVEL